MITLQAMMGLPFLVIFIYLIGSMIAFIGISIFNGVISLFFQGKAKRIPFYWSFIAPLLFTIVMVFRMFSGEGSSLN